MKTRGLISQQIIENIRTSLKARGGSQLAINVQMKYLRHYRDDDEVVDVIAFVKTNDMQQPVSFMMEHEFISYGMSDSFYLEIKDVYIDILNRLLGRIIYGKMKKDERLRQYIEKSSDEFSAKLVVNNKDHVVTLRERNCSISTSDLANYAKLANVCVNFAETQHNMFIMGMSVMANVSAPRRN